MSNNDLQMLMGGGGNLLLRRRMMMQSKEKPMPVPPNDEIWYDADSQVTLYDSTGVTEHTFSNGRGVVKFDKEIDGVSQWFRATSIKKVYLPDTTTNIGSFAFNNCTSLLYAYMPDGVTLLSQRAFYNCSSLALKELPSGLTRLANASLQFCRSLAISSLPDGITTLDAYALYGCTGIQSLMINRVSPPDVHNTSFSETSYPIYVPASAVSTYKANTKWSTYADRIYAIPE